MSRTVELDDQQAHRLAQLAKQRGISESELIAQALDALFPPFTPPARTREEQAILDRIEAEFGPLPPYRLGTFINPATIVSFVGTPLDPTAICRETEPC